MGESARKVFLTYHQILRRLAKRSPESQKCNTRVLMWQKTKEQVYDKLCWKLDKQEGKKYLFLFTRQRNRARLDRQLLRMIKDADGYVLTYKESVMRRWKIYFGGLLNEENENERRLTDIEMVNQLVPQVSKEEVRAANLWTKSWKAVGLMKNHWRHSRWIFDFD